MDGDLLSLLKSEDKLLTASAEERKTKVRLAFLITNCWNDSVGPKPKPLDGFISVSRRLPSWPITGWKVFRWSV